MPQRNEDENTEEKMSAESLDKLESPPIAISTVGIQADEALRHALQEGGWTLQGTKLLLCVWYGRRISIRIMIHFKAWTLDNPLVEQVHTNPFMFPGFFSDMHQQQSDAFSKRLDAIIEVII